jgi:hypothetical protein
MFCCDIVFFLYTFIEERTYYGMSLFVCPSDNNPLADFDKMEQNVYLVALRLLKVLCLSILKISPYIIPDISAANKSFKK